MNHIADRKIGYRSYELLINKYNTNSEIVKRTKIPRNTLYAWKSGGSVPSTYFLQYFLQLSLDVEYILTGKEKKNDTRTEITMQEDI